MKPLSRASSSSSSEDIAEGPTENARAWKLRSSLHDFSQDGYGQSMNQLTHGQHGDTSRGLGQAQSFEMEAM
jgi:hypothetical protein